MDFGDRDGSHEDHGTWWHETPERDGHFSVAGYEINGSSWVDVEKGGTPLEDTQYADHDMLAYVDTVTFHYVSPAGDDVYFTMHGGWEDWDQLTEFVDYTLDPYME